MFQPEPRIAPRHLLLQPFIHSQSDINANIAVGVGGKLPSRGMSLARNLVELIFGCDQNSKIVGTSHVRFRQTRRALRDRSVADYFLRSDAYPLVAEPRFYSCGLHLVE